MKYQYLNNVENISRENNKSLLMITIDKKSISNITIMSDYNPQTDSNNVTIRVKKKGTIIESRTFIESHLFPKYLERKKESIIIYLESFKHEAKDN